MVEVWENEIIIIVLEGQAVNDVIPYYREDFENYDENVDRKAVGDFIDDENDEENYAPTYVLAVDVIAEEDDDENIANFVEGMLQNEESKDKDTVVDVPIVVVADD